MVESHKRTLVKTLSWRIIATFTTTLVVWIFTGNFKTAIFVGILEMFLKLIIYYFHERAWNFSAWGRE